MDGTKFTELELDMPILETSVISTLVNYAEKVTFGEHVTEIGPTTFAGFTHLSGTLTIPDNVTTIGLSAFEYCSNLSIVIPNSVTSIGNDAFYNVPHIYYNGNLGDENSTWGALARN